MISRLLEKVYGLLSALPTFLLALLVIWVGWKLGSWLSRRAAIERLSARNPFLKELARTTTRWVSTAIALRIALKILDATAVLGAMLGTAGVIGIALGFAFKDTLENCLAGVLMSLRQPFAPRDLVVIDGQERIVGALTSRATILMTLDGNHLRLPNALVFRSVMLNYTRNPSRRSEFDIGVGVQENLIQAQLIGTQELQHLVGVMDDPPPCALIQSLGDSNVQLRFRGWAAQLTTAWLALACRFGSSRPCSTGLCPTGLQAFGRRTRSGIPSTLNQQRMKNDQRCNRRQSLWAASLQEKSA